MLEESRELHLNFHIDTNRINSRGRLDNMNRLELWKKKGLILLNMSQVAHDEARAGGDQRRARKAYGNIYSSTMANTSEEQMQLREIETILFPTGAATQNERNDAEIAFNARKYNATLITADGDLLTRRIELSRIGIKVMTDNDAVALVENRIAERDKRARIASQMLGVPCPEWVGND